MSPFRLHGTTIGSLLIAGLATSMAVFGAGCAADAGDEDVSQDDEAIKAPEEPNGTSGAGKEMLGALRAAIAPTLTYRLDSAHLVKEKARCQEAQGTVTVQGGVTKCEQNFRFTYGYDVRTGDAIDKHGNTIHDAPIGGRWIRLGPWALFDGILEAPDSASVVVEENGQKTSKHLGLIFSRTTYGKQMTIENNYIYKDAVKCPHTQALWHLENGKWVVKAFAVADPNGWKRPIKSTGKGWLATVKEANPKIAKELFRSGAFFGLGTLTPLGNGGDDLVGNSGDDGRLGGDDAQTNVGDDKSTRQ